MWRITHKHRPWPIGLAIGADGVRMLQLQPLGGSVAVLAGAHWPRGDVALTDALAEALHEGDFKGRQVVSSISSDEIHIRSVRLPAAAPEQLQATIADRAQELLGLETTFSRIQVIGAAPVINADDSTREVILLALPNFALHRRAEMLAKVGLRALAIEAEPLALFRGFHRLLRRCRDRMATNALVDISPTATTVLVAQGPEIIFLKKIDRGGGHLSRAAAEQLGLELADAQELREEMKQELLSRTRAMGQVQPVAPAKDDGSEIFWSLHDALRSEADALVLEIGLCLRYCSTNFGCRAVDKITLSGSEAWDPSVIYLLSERLGVRCEVVQPFRNTDVSSSRVFRDRRGMLAEWTTCMGLASWAESAGEHRPLEIPSLSGEVAR